MPNWVALCSAWPRRPLRLQVGRSVPCSSCSPPERTGVTFANTITANDSLNVQTDVYIYNGAGVAVGDIDNDGLPDIFFAGNMVSSRLYLNKGQMRFDDITAARGRDDRRGGRPASRWWTSTTTATSTSMSPCRDPCGPRRPSARTCSSSTTGMEPSLKRRRSYGIADTRIHHACRLSRLRRRRLPRSLSSSKNSPKDSRAASVASIPSGMRGETPDSYNQLYRNDCNGDVHERLRAGGHTRGSGLRARRRRRRRQRRRVAGHLRVERRVANDVLYINNGTARSATRRRSGSSTRASPAWASTSPTSTTTDGPTCCRWTCFPAPSSGGSGCSASPPTAASSSRAAAACATTTRPTPSSSPTESRRTVTSCSARSAASPASRTPTGAGARCSPTSTTTGCKDIFIGNGYPKAVNDLDYMTTTTHGDAPWSARTPLATSGGSTTSSGCRPTRAELRLPQLGRPHFTDKSAAWGMDQPGFSYGAAYADLDNDGRLDLVVNNIDAPAFIYHNVQRRTTTRITGSRVRLDGDGAERRGHRRDARRSPPGGQKQYLYSVALARLHVHHRRPRPLRSRRADARRQPRDHLARRTVSAAHRPRRRSRSSS